VGGGDRGGAEAGRGDGMRITPTQLLLIRQIDRWQICHGYAPTLQELADIGGKSKVAVRELLGHLRDKGAITRTSEARSIRLTHAGPKALSPRATKLPIVGRIGSWDLTMA
jgi:SOS-response transcriptional repressor LexA